MHTRALALDSQEPNHILPSAYVSLHCITSCLNNTAPCRTVPCISRTHCNPLNTLTPRHTLKITPITYDLHPLCPRQVPRSCGGSGIQTPAQRIQGTRRDHRCVCMVCVCCVSCVATCLAVCYLSSHFVKIETHLTPPFPSYPSYTCPPPYPTDTPGRIKRGDILVAVNGLYVTDMPFYDVIPMLKNCKAPFIYLRFLRWSYYEERHEGKWGMRREEGTMRERVKHEIYLIIWDTACSTFLLGAF
jgi:hypothetical protein